MENLVKSYGTYKKPVMLKKYSNDEIEVIVEFYDLGGDSARIIAKHWNGRTWNTCERGLFTKQEANEIAAKIIKTNSISAWDFA